MAQITDRQKDSEIIARLIYRAYVAPERANINIGDVSFIPFAAALELYARAKESENREEESRRSLLRLADAVGARTPEPEPPEETASESDAPPEPEPPPEPADTHTHTHTHTSGAIEGEGAAPGSFAGKGSGEKRAIFEHLTAFVAAHGAGARRKIAEAANGALTRDDLFAMTRCAPVPIAKWRTAEAAMQFIEEQETITP